MIPDLHGLIKKYGPKGILLDSNLLVLFYVGLVSPDLVRSFKRTQNQGFTEKEFSLLQNIVGTFKKVITTPHILAETSNYICHLNGETRKIALKLVASTVQDFKERRPESKILVRTEAFMNFGLTDSAVLDLPPKKYLVLSVDAALVIALRKKGIDAINFNHLPFSCLGNMNFLALIEAKREGQKLAVADIGRLVREFTEGGIPDYQMASLLMAIYFRGMDEVETTALTLAMRDSGDVLKFPKDQRPLVDKHSTGGIGDKVSLPLAPLLACLGFRVPMISGRGLGITGGTLDKLEAIPGFQTRLPVEQIVRQVQQVGCVICGQTERMVPADKKLYALRDVTGTVPGIPLITASILSKKLAESLNALVLDVKFGAAAFMSNRADARLLARAMVALGRSCGVNTRAVLTNMDTPLGRAAGNWLEVRESIACLEGNGPADLHELVVLLAAHLLRQTGRAGDLRRAQTVVRDCLASGAPRIKWDEMLIAQGADLRALKQKLQQEHTAPVLRELRSSQAGYVTRCDARIIGEVIRELGGGRLTREAVINHDVGVDQLAKIGDQVRRQSVLARIHAADEVQAMTARGRIKAAFTVAVRKPKILPLVAESVV